MNAVKTRDRVKYQLILQEMDMLKYLILFFTHAEIFFFGGALI
jgi:hypothetical protein